MNLKKLLDSEKSFIHFKNSSGPKMEPCGTPVKICNVLDAVSFFQQIAPCLLESSLISYMLYLGYRIP